MSPGVAGATGEGTVTRGVVGADGAALRLAGGVLGVVNLGALGAENLGALGIVNRGALGAENLGALGVENLGALGIVNRGALGAENRDDILGVDGVLNPPPLPAGPPPPRTAAEADDIVNAIAPARTTELSALKA